MHKNFFHCCSFILGVVFTLLFAFRVSAEMPDQFNDNLLNEPLGAFEQAIKDKQQKETEIAAPAPSPFGFSSDKRNETINDFVPPPPPAGGQLMNQQPLAIPQVVSKVSRDPLDLTNSKAFFEQQKKAEESKKKEVTVDQLLKLDYNTQKVPPMYYVKPFAKRNSHLPPIYHESYYSELAFVAVEREDLNAIKYFVDKYQIQDKKNSDGDTMLIHAAILGRHNAARLLLAKEVDVNEANNYKLTALHISAMRGDYEMSKILLTMGADFTLTDENGKQPLDYALENGHDKITELYQKYYKAVSKKKSSKLKIQKISETK